MSKTKGIPPLFFARAFVAYGYMSINLGLPAYPILAKHFGTPLAHVKLSMTVFLIGYAVSQIVWGLLADHYGRRPVILWATVITILGSLLTAFALSLPLFMLGRFVEALGAGFSTVLARALVVDTCAGKKLKANMTYLVLIAALMPAIAPVIGGHLLLWSNWHVIYLFLAGLGVVFLLVEMPLLKETMMNIPDHHISLPRVFVAFKDLLTNRAFLGLALPYAAVMATLLGFYAIAPFIYINQLNIKADDYGYILLYVGAGYMCGALLARFVFSHVRTITALSLGLTLNFIAVVVTVVAWLQGDMSVFSVTLAMCCFSLSCGIISPLANAGALGLLKSHQGLASALLPSMVMGLSSLATALLAGVHYTSMLPLVCFLGIACLIGLAALFGLALPAMREIG